uniref:ApaG domain-containing protein n=1 Tax=Rhabditophanes sp. KR3021 TaxID=114890 RepID=A0AC35TSH6_9BILA
MNLNHYILAFRNTQRSCLKLGRFGTTPPKNPPPPNNGIVKIGKFIGEIKNKGQYKPGQFFIHKSFAYRGVVVKAFDAPVYGSNGKNDKEKSVTIPHYQCLIHKDDWSSSKLPLDLTQYLSDTPERNQSSMTTVHGMDCVDHSEIMPYNPTSEAGYKIMDHDIFERLFEPSDKNQKAFSSFSIRKTLIEPYEKKKMSWMAPQSVHKYVSENIEITITTFYLGHVQKLSNPTHTWRYVIKLKNLTDKPITLLEQTMKLYTTQATKHINQTGTDGIVTILPTKRPCIKFCRNVEIAHAKGGYLWGKLKFTKEDGTKFDFQISSVPLEPLGSRDYNRIDSNDEPPVE